MTVYIDTSALGKLLVDSPESAALARWLDDDDEPLVSCDLLETELRRMAVRAELAQGAVTELLGGVSLAELDRSSYREAGLLPMPFLRTLDALHLQAASRLDADAVLTYDSRMIEAARAMGFEVVHPGRSVG